MERDKKGNITSRTLESKPSTKRTENYLRNQEFGLNSVE